MEKTYYFDGNILYGINELIYCIRTNVCLYCRECLGRDVTLNEARMWFDKEYKKYIRRISRLKPHAEIRCFGKVLTALGCIEK